MQDVPAVRLDIRDLEVTNTVDNDVSGVVLLATRFRIEACTVQKDAKVSTFGDGRR